MHLHVELPHLEQLLGNDRCYRISIRYNRCIAIGHTGALNGVGSNCSIDPKTQHRTGFIRCRGGIEGIAQPMHPPKILSGIGYIQLLGEVAVNAAFQEVEIGTGGDKFFDPKQRRLLTYNTVEIDIARHFQAVAFQHFGLE